MIDGDITVAAFIAMLIAVMLWAVVLFFQGVNAKRKASAVRHEKVEDYYDEESMGVIEIASRRKHGFPNALIQQIDAKAEPVAGTTRVTVWVTAEFHSAEFRFSEQEAKTFVATMERALPEFKGTIARQKLQEAIATGATTMLFIDTVYARDMGISPSEA